MTHTASGAIRLGSGLKETATVKNPTATVEHQLQELRRLEMRLPQSVPCW